MKNLVDYYNQYGHGGWKTNEGGAKAPLVMMLRDEIAMPGSTILSQLDRAELQRSFSTLKGDAMDEQRLTNFDLPFTSLRLDPTKVPQLTITNPVKDLPRLDEAWKEFGAIQFVHGEKANPFTMHTDWMSKDGSFQKDIIVKTDLDAVKAYYQGAINSTLIGNNIFQTSTVITSPEILTKLLQLVIQNGIDTAANVDKYFGDYAFAPNAADTAIAIETKLPEIAALNDPTSDSLFKAYIAYFGRPADPSGLDFWVNAVNKNNGDVTGMVNNFGNSVEYRSLYAGASSEEVVNSLYQHLFNRDSEAGGLKFWSGHLDSGALTLSNIAFSIVNAAQSSDATIVSEKVFAARAFTTALDTQREVDLYSNNTSALNARKWLSAVDENHTDTVKLVGITNDVINNLQGHVDPFMAAIGFQPGYF